MTVDVRELNERIRVEAAALDRVSAEIRKVIVGQKGMIDRLLIGLLGNGHVLLEGVPGLAKTLAVTTLAKTIRASFHRIQFTPDLLPADLVGTMIYNPKEQSFSVRKGPVFCNIVLADEVNRAPAKVQSALLEAMQERQVTIGDTTYPLPDPFLVLATQNPIEQEGTYALPEAQLDRFMLKLKITYPTRAEEKDVLERMTARSTPEASPVVDTAEVVRLRSLVHEIYIDDKVKEYILDIVFATREPAAAGLDIKSLIAYGASPRATIFLTTAAKAHALVRGRGYVTPEDVKAIAYDVLRHRVLITYEAEAEEVTSEEVIRRVLDRIEVP
ncbi:MAG: AAA family ATPase [bacterium]